MINVNNSISNKMIYTSSIDSSLIENYENNTNVFINQNVSNTQQKLINFLTSNASSSNYYKDMILNLYFNNNLFFWSNIFFSYFNCIASIYASLKM